MTVLLHGRDEAPHPVHAAVSAAGARQCTMDSAGAVDGAPLPPPAEGVPMLLPAEAVRRARAALLSATASILNDARDREEEALVIDAGRLRWRVGRAGEDSPSDICDEGWAAVASELQGLRGRADAATPRDPEAGSAVAALLDRHRDSCWAQFVGSATGLRSGQQRTEAQLALVMLPLLLQDAAGEEEQARWFLRKLFVSTRACLTYTLCAMEPRITQSQPWRLVRCLL